MALAYYLNSIQPLFKLRVLILTALLIFLLSKILVSVLKPSIAIICLRLMSFFRIYLADYYIFCLRLISFSVSARYCIPQCVRLIAGGGGRLGGVHDRLHIYPLCGIFYFTISNVESQVLTLE